MRNGENRLELHADEFRIETPHFTITHLEAFTQLSKHPIAIYDAWNLICYFVQSTVNRLLDVNVSLIDLLFKPIISCCAVR
jgi:hypothetical protein